MNMTIFGIFFDSWNSSRQIIVLLDKHRGCAVNVGTSSLLFLSAASAASPTTTVAVSAPWPFLFEKAVNGIGSHYEEEKKNNYTLCVHNINVTIYAASHAMRHWNTRIIKAQVVPSSLRIVAMAAMHGV